MKRRLSATLALLAITALATACSKSAAPVTSADESTGAVTYKAAEGKKEEAPPSPTFALQADDEPVTEVTEEEERAGEDLDRLVGEGDMAYRQVPEAPAASPEPEPAVDGSGLDLGALPAGATIELAKEGYLEEYERKAGPDKVANIVIDGKQAQPAENGWHYQADDANGPGAAQPPSPPATTSPSSGETDGRWKGEADKEEGELGRGEEQNRRSRGGKLREKNVAQTNTTRSAVTESDVTKGAKDTGKRDKHLVRDESARKPDRFLPRMLYFENTYLGGDAAYRENLRRINEALGQRARPHELAHAYPQPFDAPEDDGLALTAELDRRTFDKPGRVFLQVGLQGSKRFGWRRPPLEVVLILDPPALASGNEPAIRVILELLNQLGPQDRLAVLVAGEEPRVLAPLDRIHALRVALPPALESLAVPPATPSTALGTTMKRAGGLLRDASLNRTTLPGTQTVLILTSGSATDRVSPATSAAHDLTLQGIVTSVIEVDAARGGPWWAVANAGYGNYHRIEGGDPSKAVHDELDTLSRVVARLVRVNIRLSKNAEGIRILGSRVLDKQEVKRVKAREVAADRNLSKTMGVKADRGDDDDGIQTVIPYFYGGDAHVILVELWVERPGPIADITLRYKDMVNLSNATARTSVALRNVPREDTPEQLAIRRNLRGLGIAEALEHASLRVKHSDPDGALEWLRTAEQAAQRTTDADRRVVTDFARLVDRRDWVNDSENRRLLSESLYLAGRRKVGEPAE